MRRLLVGLALMAVSFGTMGATIYNGGGGGLTGWPTDSTTKEITWANSEANCVKIGDGSNYGCFFWDATLGWRFTTFPIADARFYIPTNKNGGPYSEEGACWIEKMDPDAASPNLAFQYECAGAKPLMSVVVALSPRGATTMTETNILANQPKSWWGTLTDVDTDAFDFYFPITAKMVGATTATVRLVGVSDNAAPSGNVVLSCAMQAFRPGTDTYVAHSTTGQVNVTLTPATQNRPVGATSTAITFNGTVADGGEMIGSCEVDAGGTTSAQLTDFFLRGFATIQLLVNSRSD